MSKSATSLTCMVTRRSKFITTLERAVLSMAANLSRMSAQGSSSFSCPRLKRPSSSQVASMGSPPTKLTQFVSGPSKSCARTVIPSKPPFMDGITRRDRQSTTMSNHSKVLVNRSWKAYSASLIGQQAFHTTFRVWRTLSANWQPKWTTSGEWNTCITDHHLKMTPKASLRQISSANLNSWRLSDCAKRRHHQHLDSVSKPLVPRTRLNLLTWNGVNGLKFLTLQL